jgi:hypothetical protein
VNPGLFVALVEREQREAAVEQPSSHERPEGRTVRACRGIRISVKNGRASYLNPTNQNLQAARKACPSISPSGHDPPDPGRSCGLFPRLLPADRRRARRATGSNAARTVGPRAPCGDVRAVRLGDVGLRAEIVAERVGRPIDDVAVRTFAGVVVGAVMAAMFAIAEDPVADMAEKVDDSMACVEDGLRL